MGIGDWGLGIGQSPIPNPQSPNILNKLITKILIIILLVSLIFNYYLIF